MTAARSLPAEAGQSAAPLLDIRGLRVGFRTETGAVTVVEGVDVALPPGRTLALVGESGCGKTVTAMSLLRLLPMPPARIEGGTALFDGVDLLALSERRLRDIRGNRIGMVFQEPMTSLNPTFTIGFQIEETLRLHRTMGGAARRAAALEALALVGVGAAARRLAQYPHELSGGLRQRVMIAMAIICRPALLIADEPTTALDVTVQAQILELLAGLKRELGMAMLLITHDLGVVAEQADAVAVMYAGRIVERAATVPLFARPRHPYTALLLAATPRLGHRPARLATIPGAAPPPGRRPAGCPFTPRCPNALPRCAAEMPPLGGTVPGHAFACWNPMP